MDEPPHVIQNYDHFENLGCKSKPIVDKKERDILIE